MTKQLDLIRDDPRTQAQHWRIAAETARNDPHWLPSEREKRAAYYERQAQRIESGEIVA